MIRDRKMYVAPTPFALAEGLAGTRTLIVPETHVAPNNFKEVGNLIRREADKLVVGYRFNLEINEISATNIPNPGAGKEHGFSAYRLYSDSDKSVILN